MEEARRRRAAEATLREMFARRGYQEVTLPAVEEVETAALREGPAQALYRFLDQDGSVWALRADATPGVARLVATRDAGGERPLRLCYLAELYRRFPGQRGPSLLAQAGAELIGLGGPLADGEVLGLAAAALEGLGFREYRVAVGHVGLLRELLAAAGLDDLTSGRALAALQAGDYVELEAILRTRDPAGGSDWREILTWRGQPASFLRRLSPPFPGGALAARWEEFRSLLEEACRLGLEPALTVDLGLVRDRAYYTGMVFEISLPGRGRPVGGGGRYDRLLERWGPAEPATGFGINLNDLLGLDAVRVGEEARRPGSRRGGLLVAVH